MFLLVFGNEQLIDLRDRAVKRLSFLRTGRPALGACADRITDHQERWKRPK